jgi:hypothetical protein
MAMAMIISYAHSATRNVMNRAVEFVLIAMFVASVKQYFKMAALMHVHYYLQ